MAMTEQEMQMQIEIAKAKARAAKAKNENLTNEVQQKSPQQKMPPETYDSRGVPTGGGSNSDLMPGSVMPEGHVAAGQPQEFNMENAPVRIGQGVLNAGRNINSLGLAGADTLIRGATAGRYHPELSQKYEQAYPNTVGDTTKDKLLLGVGETLPGVVAGGGLAGAAEKAIVGPYAGGMRGYVGRATNSLAGGSVGGAMTSDKSQEPLTGERIKTDPNGDHDTQLLYKTINIAADNLLTGAGLGAVSKTAGVVGRYMKDRAGALLHWKDMSDIKRRFMGAILDAHANLGPNASNEEKAAAYKKSLDLIKENSKITHEFGDDGVKNIDRSADTVTALTEKSDPANPNDTSKKIALEGLRSSALSGGSPKLETSLSAPKRELDSTLDQIHDSRGGKDAIEQTRANLVKSGQAEVDAAHVPVGKAKDDIVAAQKGADQLVRNDPTFGPELSNAEKSGVQLDLNKTSLDKQSQVVQDAEQVRKLDRSGQDFIHKSIPKDTPADMQSFNSILEKTKPHLPKYINDLIDSGDGSYAYLHNKVRPAISDYLSKLRVNPDPNVDMRQVIELQDNLRNTQLSELTKSNNPETRKAAEAAVAEDKRVGSTWNDGIGSDLQDNVRAHPPETNPNKFIEKGRAAVISAIKDPNRRESIEQLRGILKRTPSLDMSGATNAASEGNIDDIIFAEGIKGPIAKVQEGGKLSDLEVKELVSPLRDMAGNMSPAGKARAEKFLNDFQNRKWDVAKLQEDLKGFEDTAKETEAKIYQGSLGDFFERNYKGKYDPKTNGNEILKGIFHDPHAGNKLDEIAARATPEDMKGLQAAWVSTAKKDLQNTKDVPMLADHFTEFGHKLFPDNPKVVDGIIKLNKEAKAISEANKIRQAQGLPMDENQVRMSTVTSQALVMLFGVLNPRSAKIRTVTRDVLRNNDSTSVSKRAADEILSDSQEALRVGDQIVKDLASKIPDNQKTNFFRILTQAGLYTQRMPEDRSDAKSQTEKAFKK